MFDKTHDMPFDIDIPSTDDNVYSFGSVGKHNVVLTGLPKGKIGTVSAAVVARTMVNTFPSIKFGFMIGIGGGIPSKDNDIRLCDVVVSSPTSTFPGVVQWDLGKAREGGSFERTGALNPPPHVLLSALTFLESIHERRGSSILDFLQDLEMKEQRLMRSYGQSDSLKDILFLPDNPHRNQDSGGKLGDGCEFCDNVKIVERDYRDEPIKVHYGLIASGNQVIKDANLRDKLNEDFDGKVLCVEMETAGLMETFPCVVIRGICDYADSHKNKKWQKYASLIAAAYAKELLLVVPCRAVEHMATISGKLDGLSKKIENIERINQQKDILEWIAPVHYDSQQHSFFNQRQEGTGQWLLESKNFDNLSTKTQIMFCEGFPGAGKTILASTVINYLQHAYRTPPDKKVGLAFVFGDFSKRAQQKPVDILASILGQLLQNQSHVPTVVNDFYNEYQKIPASCRSSNDNPMFTKMLHEVITSIYTRVFIVIDALDELQETHPLLFEIFGILKNTCASLFITSRPIEQIHRRIQSNFKGHLPFMIRAQNEDIECYIDGRLLNLNVFDDEIRDYSQETKAQLKTEIKLKVSEAADGIFLLAKFHIDSLEDKTTPQKIRDSLATLFKGPDAYTQAYSKTVEKINSQGPELRLLAKHVLQWLICSERILSNSELQHALSINVNDTSLPNQDSLENTHTILSVCMGLVIAEESSRNIRLLHYTTLEFLRANLDCLESVQDSTYPTAQNAEASAQRYITETCITYL